MCFTTNMMQSVSISLQMLHFSLHKTQSPCDWILTTNHLAASLTVDVPFLESHVSEFALPAPYVT